MRTDQNGAGETFWTISTPLEFGGVEVSLRATANGLQFGDKTISWAALDNARNNALFGKALLTIAEAKKQAMRCGCRGHDDYCPCQNVPDSVTLATRAFTAT